MGDAALTRPDQTRPDQAGFLGRYLEYAVLCPSSSLESRPIFAEDSSYSPPLAQHLYPSSKAERGIHAQ
ncbi:hypothetical protein WAI453_012931 [Rhynchosporium graminicola]